MKRFLKTALLIGIAGIIIIVFAMGSKMYANMQHPANGIGIDPQPHPIIGIDPNKCQSWQTISTPKTVQSSTFVAIAALNANDIWTIGNSGSSPLIEHWDGQQWSVVAISSSQNSAIKLNGIVAIAANDAWIVGSGPNAQTFIEHWDGQSWRVVTSPNVSQQNNTLNAIAADSANDIWAVGNTEVNQEMQPLVEHWDGTRWSIVSNAKLNGSDGNVISGVTAISPTNVWIVGGTLIEHWDGHLWQKVSNNATGTLKAVAALSAKDIWAVGATGVPQTGLAEHWDGTSWKVNSPGAIEAKQASLSAMAVVSSNDIWAVGTYESYMMNYTEAYIEHWNGQSWQTTLLDNDRNNEHFITGITSSSAHGVWIVGRTLNVNGQSIIGDPHIPGPTTDPLAMYYC
jgi:hypothetical protein